MSLRRNFTIWFRRNGPSGIVSGLIAFFVISYIIIAKLDENSKRVVSVVRTGVNVIPMEIMQEFEQGRVNVGKGVIYDFDKEDRRQINGVNSSFPAASADEFENQMKLERSQRAGEITVLSAHNDTKRNDLKSMYSKDLHPAKPIEAMVSSPMHKLIHEYNAFSESKEKRTSINRNQCVLLRTHHGNAPICIHDPADDEIISGRLAKDGLWEGNYLYIIGSILSREPNIEVLDLGCNIGVYTIISAKLKHRVVALDPNKINIRLLNKSLNLGGLSRYVTLLWNAISDVRENVTLFDIIGNIGGSFVETADKNATVDDDHKSFAITLDDLIGYFVGKPVFVKMDIETYELRALKGGSQFFKEIDVRYVLMEWVHHREFDTGKVVIKLMEQYGLFPHVNAHVNTRLEPDHYRSWPDNILWIKYPKH
ncbi:uncharacterized protein LOC127874229 [Dreissena polymorpha]|uniref:Methyltransferase FkbM domain-containing protein n=1 Tax=Dreissena polymorpha TaxID=45954 RepID=A0A9D4QZD4_DREPO|nr:uncharacterized protein LOC127874229 [Dreissena polymorpha]XP_052274414.1 uncharacterized protein LOC127874229 [Dreissena polymorpha]KAH3849331.1 hypothetical protein DPMN_091730 [Dreissena polymorpha]